MHTLWSVWPTQLQVRACQNRAQACRDQGQPRQTHSRLAADFMNRARVCVALKCEAADPHAASCRLNTLADYHLHVCDMH